MTPDDLHATLERLGLSQVAAGALLGVTDRGVRMWLSGDRAVPPPAARFLRYLVVAKIDPDDVMRRLRSRGK